MRVLLVLAAAGCTTTYVVQTPPTSAQLSGFNASLRDREVELRLAEGKVRGRDLTLGAEATWTDAKGQPHRVPLEALQSVRFLSPKYAHERGASEGAVFGLLTGAAVGAAIGFASGDDTCPATGWCFGPHFSASKKAGLFAIGLGAVGLLSGLIGGGLRGHHDELELNSPR
jgi:hypothetical protein